MDILQVTMIDVGWGDSILLATGNPLRPDGTPNEEKSGWSFALIDCNDTVALRSSHIFLQRYFERLNRVVPTPGVTFEWVLLTHVHADHGQGLKRALRSFGTRRLWYPDSNSKAIYFSALLRYANRSARVMHHQTVDDTHIPPNFGSVTVKILWPPPGLLPINENNNSVVLALSLGSVSFVLTGDAEADGVWTQLAQQIPSDTEFFKVPHHGAANGLFDASGRTPWLNQLGPGTRLGISSHVKPFPHPSPSVVSHLAAHPQPYYRTDHNFHLCFETNGTAVTVHHSHV